MLTIEKYINDCNNGISYDKNKYINLDKPPLITIIIPIYQADKYINIAYKSIRNQSFKRVEIMFINDFPNNTIDNTIINNLQENDKRIVLLKNTKNRGSFYSRNTGVYFAKGKYVQLLDVDDLLINNILLKSYEEAENNNLEIVQYPFIYVYRNGEKKIKYLRTTEGIVNQPELKNIMCFENGKFLFKLHKFFLWDKLIQKKTYINGLDYIGKKYIQERYEFADDTFTFYAIINAANSYKYIDNLGYYYYKNRNNSCFHLLLTFFAFQLIIVSIF